MVKDVFPEAHTQIPQINVSAGTLRNYIARPIIEENLTGNSYMEHLQIIVHTRIQGIQQDDAVPHIFVEP